MLAAVAVVLAAAVGGTASGAPTRASVDTFITGKVVSRVPGKNLAVVDVVWDYKCLGDKLGDARFEWTLKLVRKEPRPERTTTLGKGTSKKGSLRVRLAPGGYLPLADPFFCETERGAGTDKPEAGAPFVVPDYCAWSLTSARGQVLLEQGGSVRVVRAGSTVSRGGAISTPGSGTAALRSNAGDGTAIAAPASKLSLASQCVGKVAWKLQLGAGAVTATVPARSSGKLAYEVGTANAVASGRPGASWRVQYAPGGRRTTVRALAGSVVVAGAGGRSVTLTKGLSTVVAGSGAPSRPSRG